MGSSVGQIKANDADAGENAEMWYSIVEGDGQDAFSVITDRTIQEGVIIIKKVNGQISLVKLLNPVILFIV